MQDQEVELKLSGSVNNQLKYVGDSVENVLQKLYEALRLLGITYHESTPQKIDQHDIYFDTKQRFFMQQNASLRIRKSHKGIFLTLKTLIGTQSALSRHEFEIPVDSRKGSYLDIVTQYFRTHFPEMQNENLYEILEVVNQRYIISIQTSCGHYDLCFDKYEYYCKSTGQSSDPLYEIEIEQVGGEQNTIGKDSDIYRLSQLMTVLMGFQIDKRSKYERGITWLQSKDVFDSRIFVLFDFVSYSMQPSHTQKQLVLSFSKLIHPLLGQTSPDCIKIPIGDGMILGFPKDVNIVAFLNQFFFNLHGYNKRTPEIYRLNVRTSLHYGCVYEYTDINGNVNFAGDGINIVARIGSQTQQGQVLFSEDCYSYLSNTGTIDLACVSSPKDIVVKHGVSIIVRNYRDNLMRVGIPLDSFDVKSSIS